MGKIEYEKELLDAWEDVFKKGQVTLWTLLALKESDKHMAEILDFISAHTHGKITVEDQSLYRALRRYYDSHIVDFTEVPSEQGPQKKVYHLTEIGQTLLADFLQKNIIALYYSAENKKLIEQ